MIISHVTFDSKSYSNSHTFGLGLSAYAATADEIAEAEAACLEEMTSPYEGPTDLEIEIMARDARQMDLMESGFGEFSLLELSSNLDADEAVETDVARLKIEVNTAVFNALHTRRPAPAVEPARFDHAAWKKAKRNRKAGYVTPAWTPSRQATAADMADSRLGLARRYA